MFKYIDKLLQKQKNRDKELKYYQKFIMKIGAEHLCTVKFSNGHILFQNSNDQIGFFFNVVGKEVPIHLMLGYLSLLYTQGTSTE